MRWFFILIGFAPFISMAQNPLKKEIKSSNTPVFYSPSNFNFTGNKSEVLLIMDLNDNRSMNWNKQINDSIRIDLIRDFWNYPYKTLFKNKISQDLSKQGLRIDFSPSAGQYVIEPTMDAHSPNYVNYPKKGYYVYTKINMRVSKDGAELFNKAYQDYYFFTKGHPNFSDEFTKDFHEGTNVAMWIGVRHVLDKFYSDLNDAFQGKSISKDMTPLTLTAIESNIAGDKNLVTQQKSFSEAKDKKVDGKQVADNYKMEESPELPTPTIPNENLEKAVGALNSKELKPKETIKPISKTPVKLDSNALAIRRMKEEARKRAIDSAMKQKEELAKANKAAQLLAKSDAKDKPITVSKLSRRDSILKANEASLADKIRMRAMQDSLKKTEVNAKIELAKQKREERKKQMGTTTSSNEMKSPKESASVSGAGYSSNSQTSSSPRLGQDRSTNISEEIRRIAREVEEEERRKGNGESYSTRSSASTYASTPVKSGPSPEEIKAAREAKLASLKAEREAKLATLKAEAEKKTLALKQEKEAKMIKDSLEKAKKAEEKRLASIKPIDPKKYAEDSMKLEAEKRKKREAILAAQRAAMEAERAELSKNPNAGEMFAVKSTDPPSKLPDNRSREQILADRIFTPKNDVSKNLLARVKMISPEEEMQMLSQMKSSELSSVDSFFIDYQKNRPILPPAEEKSANEAKPTKDKESKNSKKDSKSNSQNLKQAVDTMIKKAANPKALATKTETKKEEIKKELVNKSLESIEKTETAKPAIPNAMKAPTSPSTPAKVAATPPATKPAETKSKEDQFDDDIKKKAEMLKKKAQGE